MGKKHITFIAASILALTLAGCSTKVTENTSTVTLLNETYENSSTPQWSEKSVEFLKEQNWDVVSTSDYMVKKYNIPTPQKFQARNEDKTCYINYSITYQDPALIKQNVNPYYSTQSNMTEMLNLLFLNVKIEEIQNETLKVAESNPIEVLTARYSFARQNGVSENESTFSNITSNGYQMTRMLDKTVTDHSRLEAVNNQLYPVISLNYQCVGEEINPEMWKQIVKNAEINFKPLSKPDGEPIDYTQIEGPTLDDRSFE